MAKRKKGSGSFATKFLGPTTGGRGRGPNTGSTWAGHRTKKKTSKGVFGQARG